MQTFKQPNDFEPEGGGTVMVFYVVLIVLGLAIACGTSLFQSYMEMRTFNKFSTTKNHSLDAITIDAGVLDQKSCTPGTVGFGPWTGYFWDKDRELCYATISNSWDTLRIYMDKEYRFVDIKRVINKTVDNGKTWTNELIDWEKEK